MNYRVFYFFEGSGESVDSTSPTQMSAKSIHEELLHRLQGVDDYIGIFDSRDNLLQVLREPGGERYWIELPMDGARASYGRFMSFTELERFILDLPALFEQTAIPDLLYRPW